MIVIDTNVFAYALLGAQSGREPSLRAIQSAQRVIVPDSFRAEFINVLWQWIRHRDLNYEDALSALNNSEGFIDEVVSTEQIAASALDLAARHDISPYDSLFIAAAIRRDAQLLTYDKELLRKFPSRAMIPPSAIHE